MRSSTPIRGWRLLPLLFPMWLVQPVVAQPASLPKSSSARLLLGCADLSDGQRSTGPRDRQHLASVEAAAEAGRASCQLLLGHWYEDGAGVSLSMSRATDLYRQAAVNNGRGHVALGRIVEAAWTPDYALARRHYADAIAHPVPAGEVELARLYREGLGGPKDQAEALRVLRMGAYRGDNQSWRDMHLLSDYASLSDEAQQRMDYLTWRRNYWQRLSQAMSMAHDQGVLPGAGSGVWLAEFSKGAQRPQVGNMETSGRDDLDRAVTRVLAQVAMPPPPPGEQNMSLKIPLSVAPREPAAAASGR
ncbi:MAG: sel1 repeat family protein [Burkholderiaceae bacterium]|nr:sel1 repeat family protein [Burkholderiaceae bacterium]